MSQTLSAFRELKKKSYEDYINSLQSASIGLQAGLLDIGPTKKDPMSMILFAKSEHA